MILTYDFIKIMKDDLFLVEKSNVKKYSLPLFEIEREVLNLFDEEIVILELTEMYIFGVSKSGLIKIWDYNFRGSIDLYIGNMCCQQYNIGEPLSHLIISN